MINQIWIGVKIGLGASLILLVGTLVGTLLNLNRETHLTATSLRSTLSQTQLEIQRLGEELKGTSQNLNAVLIQAGLTSDEVRRAAMEQRAYWAKNSVETHTLLTHLDQVSRDVDLAVVVNGAMIAREIDANGGKLASNLTHLQSTIDDADRVLIHTNSVMYENERVFGETMQNVAKTSENVAIASTSLASASKDISEKVHQLTRPGKWWMSVGGMVLKTGAEVSQWVYGFFK